MIHDDGDGLSTTSKIFSLILQSITLTAIQARKVPPLTLDKKSLLWFLR